MNHNEDSLELVKKHIKRYPNFPKPGITFLDIFSVLRNYKAFQALQKILIDHVRKMGGVDVIAALESRGFLFGPIVALELGLPFVPIRKKGKLPGKVEQVSFTLEYGQDVFEIQSESILPNQRVLLLDDLLATGGFLLYGKLLDQTLPPPLHRGERFHFSANLLMVLRPMLAHGSGTSPSHGS